MYNFIFFFSFIEINIWLPRALRATYDYPYFIDSEGVDDLAKVTSRGFKEKSVDFSCSFSYADVVCLHTYTYKPLSFWKKSLNFWGFFSPKCWMGEKILRRFDRKEKGHRFCHSVSWSWRALTGRLQVNYDGWVPKGATTKWRWFAENEICEQRPEELDSCNWSKFHNSSSLKITWKALKIKMPSV